MLNLFIRYIAVGLAFAPWAGLYAFLLISGYNAPWILVLTLTAGFFTANFAWKAFKESTLARSKSKSTIETHSLQKSLIYVDTNLPNSSTGTYFSEEFPRSKPTLYTHALSYQLAREALSAYGVQDLVTKNSELKTIVLGNPPFISTRAKRFPPSLIQTSHVSIIIAKADDSLKTLVPNERNVRNTPHVKYAALIPAA